MRVIYTPAESSQNKTPPVGIYINIVDKSKVRIRSFLNYYRILAVEPAYNVERSSGRVRRRQLWMLDLEPLTHVRAMEINRRAWLVDTSQLQYIDNPPEVEEPPIRVQQPLKSRMELLMEQVLE